MKTMNISIIYIIVYMQYIMPMTLFQFAYLTRCKEKLIDFLIQNVVLTNTIKCGKCNNDININKETLIYRYRASKYAE